MVGASPSGSAVVDYVNNLDASNHLHVQNSDNSNSVIILFKLLGTKNYRIWSGAMKLALQARNKFRFVDGSCLKESFATSEVLSAQWDKCNAMVLTQIMNVVSQDVYMGLVYSENAATVKCNCDASKELGFHQQLMKLMQFLMGLDDCYQPVRSSLLTREPLPEVKDAYIVVSREESHRGVLESSGVTESKMNVTSFAAKSFNINNSNNNNRRGYNNSNNNTRGNLPSNRGPNPNLNCKHYGKISHTIDRCFELVSFPNGFKRSSNSNIVKQGFNTNADFKQNEKTCSGNPSSGFTSEQMQKLLSLINETPSSIHANMA
ncbi:ribonuclease H-like domain-containing protein, partial [Tanacetum coccineum]